MGYAGLPDGGERLYVVDCNGGASDSLGLGSIDTTTFTLSFIGAFQPTEPSCELTGTGDGRLFGFCLGTAGGSKVIQIDPTDAHVIAEKWGSARSENPERRIRLRILGAASFWIFHDAGRNIDRDAVRSGHARGDERRNVFGIDRRRWRFDVRATLVSRTHYRRRRNRVRTMNSTRE